MSGGRYDYKQYNIQDIVEIMEEDLQNPDVEMHTKTHIALCKHQLELAQTYVHRLDWLLSGDDGWESFNKRLQEELSINDT